MEVLINNSDYPYLKFSEPRNQIADRVESLTSSQIICLLATCKITTRPCVLGIVDVTNKGLMRVDLENKPANCSGCVFSVTPR
jgi:hypothetical protein